ncbi:MAG: cysteine--tRNA ligase [Nitrososphaerota archaeon]|nr:cysteine--tRNA ligase [Nitrososphaerota archaeon]MDG7036524.1 cysteine--tRNA ligase [Nitrososphaerota archaeon]MDG7039263.1 cysteine--tRNA ligase [Nitrososphaerota archaeon]
MNALIKLKSTLDRRSHVLGQKGSTRISIYTCGITPYDSSHIGHARTILIFDVLRRLLKSAGFDVLYIQNFTDVDDKIINRASEEGVEAKDIADRYIAEYFRDFDSLNILRADLYTRATDYIDDIRSMIRGLIERGSAYARDTGVYYDVSSFEGYGKLSKVRPEALRAGARVESKDDKDDPADFALWKLYDSGPLYESEWGKGRPGWHIECSAMILKNIGETVDIHGGGEDLIFPHHENEIAQSEAFTGKPLARIWMHVGLLNLKNEKMSKSLRNTIPVKSFIDQYGPNTLRMLLLSSQYRNQLEYSEETIAKAKSRWRIIEEALYITRREIDSDNKLNNDLTESLQRHLERAKMYLMNDLNTPIALGECVLVAEGINSLYSRGLMTKGSAVLLDGFSKLTDIFGFKLPDLSESEIKSIEVMITKRNLLRKAGNYEEADRIRSELATKKIELLDFKGRTYWKKVEWMP